MGSVLQVLLAGCQFKPSQPTQFAKFGFSSCKIKYYQSIVIYSNALSQQMFRCQRFDDLPFYKYRQHYIRDDRPILFHKLKKLSPDTFLCFKTNVTVIEN